MKYSTFGVTIFLSKFFNNISFAKGIYSAALPLESPKVIGLDESMSCNIAAEHKRYLAYHRAEL